MSKNFDFNNWQDRLRNWQTGSKRTTVNDAPAGEEPTGQSRKTGRQAREFVEEIRVSGQNLVGTVERLLKETEIRRLRIRQGERVLLDIPVTWAALGAIVAPALAAVGAIAAVVTDCTVEVTRAQDRPAAAASGFSRPTTPPTPARPTTEGPTSPDDLSFR